MSATLSDSDYRALHEFRYAIRHFTRFSEEVAREAGVEPQQHQLMLAIRAGHDIGVSELAERMQLKHHSVVELLDRLVERGFATRHRSEPDRRHVQACLTPEGARVAEEISSRTLAQLRSAGPELVRTLNAVIGEARDSAAGAPAPAVRR
jgi:DNA-binding MarR family transcriptional regulator